MFLIRWAKAAYEPVLKKAVQFRWPVAGGGSGVCRVRRCSSRGSDRSSFPTLDEKDVAMHAMRIPSTGITQSQAMQFDVERGRLVDPRGRVHLLQDRHGGDGDRSDAAERLRHVHHLEGTRASGGARRNWTGSSR